MTMSETIMTSRMRDMLHIAEKLTTKELIRVTQELFRLCFQRRTPKTSGKDVDQLKQMNVNLNITVEYESVGLSPGKKSRLLEVLATLEPLDEEFPDVDEGLFPSKRFVDCLTRVDVGADCGHGKRT